MKVSIVTVVLNQCETVGDAIRSVAVQTYDQHEHIVKDGGSTDGTLDVIRSYNAPKLSLLTGADAGIYDAINKGIEATTGDVIGLLHSDDFLSSTTVLDDIVAAFDDEPAVQGVYGDLEYVSASDASQTIRYWRAGKFDMRKLAHGWMPPHPTLYLRREVFEKYGAYNTSYEIAADYEAILRWLTVGRIELKYIPEVLVKMRLGGISNRSLKHVFRKSQEDLRALREHRIGGLGTLALKNLGKLGQFWMRPRKTVHIR